MFTAKAAQSYWPGWAPGASPALPTTVGKVNRYTPGVRARVNANWYAPSRYSTGWESRSVMANGLSPVGSGPPAVPEPLDQVERVAVADLVAQWHRVGPQLRIDGGPELLQLRLVLVAEGDRVPQQLVEQLGEHRDVHFLRGAGVRVVAGGGVADASEDARLGRAGAARDRPVTHEVLPVVGVLRVVQLPLDPVDQVLGPALV